MDVPGFVNVCCSGQVIHDSHIELLVVPTGRDEAFEEVEKGGIVVGSNAHKRRGLEILLCLPC